MEQVFTTLLIPSCVGVALTVITTTLKPITRKYFSAGWNYYIWLAVLAVMMIPLRISMPETFEKEMNEIKWETKIDEGRTVIKEENDDSIVEWKQEEFADNEENDFLKGILRLLSYIWLIVATLIFTIKLFVFCVFIVRIKRCSHEVDFDRITKYTKRKVKVRRSHEICAPLTVGLIRPTLILPEERISDEELHYVLMHEITHIERNDILIKWVVTIIKCVHWFNPVVWFIGKQIDAECEISCDLEVVKTMNLQGKKEYMETILSLLEKHTYFKSSIVTGMAGTKKMLKRRFIMIGKMRNVDKKTKIVSGIVATIIIGASLVVSGIVGGWFDTENTSEEIITDRREGKDFNLLFLGVDEQGRADTVMVMSVKGEMLEILSIPRNVELDAAEINERKTISNMLANEDGERIVVDAIRSQLNIPVHYYAIAKLDAIEKVVDSVGGIDFNVPMDMEYDDPHKDLHIKLKAGMHTLNGKGACGLLQFRRGNDGRGYADGDMSRIEVGQRFVEEFINQKLRLENITMLSEIFVEIKDSITTNYPIKKFIADAKIILDNKENVEFGTLVISEDGEVEKSRDEHNKQVTNDKINGLRISRPCKGEIVTSFGGRTHPITGEVKMHNGIDIKADEGTEVLSSISGRVIQVGFDSDRGNYIVVENGNVKTVYSQLLEVTAQEGDRVNAGSAIALVGSTGKSTGAHLHFEVMVNDEYINPEKLF